MEENTKIEYRTNSFTKGSTFQNILLATFVGMTAMTLSLIAGLPIILNMIVLMLSIYLMLRWRSGKALYTLTKYGISQEVIPFYKKSGGKKVRNFTWNDIKSYQIGKDRKRNLEEYHYITIKLKNGKGKLVINDQIGDPKQFEMFRNEFEKLVEGQNDTKIWGSFKDSKSKKPNIIKKQSFYETWSAKLLTLIFVVMSIFFIVLWSQGKMNERNLFRLLIIIIPGTIYMVSRSFFPKRDK